MGQSFSRMQRDLSPRGRIAARGNSEGHILALTRAGIGIGILDCFVGDSDPSLRRVLSDPVAAQIVWAESHVLMARAPRVRAVIDFLGEVFARDSNLLQGHRPPRPEQEDSI